MAKNSNSSKETRQAPPVRGKQTGRTSGGRSAAAVAPNIKKRVVHVPVKVAPAKVAPVKAATAKVERAKGAAALPLKAKEPGTPNFTFYANPTVALVCLPAGAAVLFSLEDTAHFTGVHPDLLRYYSRVGLIETVPGAVASELFFEEDALHEIRRIEHYRRRLGVGRQALPLVCELRRESERQEVELRFLRYPEV